MFFASMLELGYVHLDSKSVSDFLFFSFLGLLHPITTSVSKPQMSSHAVAFKSKIYQLAYMKLTWIRMKVLFMFFS